MNKNGEYICITEGKIEKEGEGEVVDAKSSGTHISRKRKGSGSKVLAC